MNKQEKLTNTILLVIVLLTSSILPAVMAVIPPTIPGNETYKSELGVLDTDTYILYPYEEESLNIGFSKYGEMIDGDMGLGLEYKGVDAFANSMVPKELWCSGWIMDIHYTEGGYLRNVWAYALFSDRTILGIEGDWKNNQLSKDASAVGDSPGGRRTNGFAESDDIRVIYDGPRKAIYLLKTTIYDKNQANPLVSLTIQLVFDKVSKNVMEIKDIKRIDNNKLKGPFQIEFSQRAEWDIGLSSSPESYAEFYTGLPTSYDKHPFYDPNVSVEYDLCQMISEPENPSEDELVGYAAFWPPLISKWVTETYNVRRLDNDVNIASLLKTLVTYEFDIQLPTDATQLTDPRLFYDTTTGEMCILLPQEPVEYPRGMGEWSASPWLFKLDNVGWAKQLEQVDGTPGSWYWDETIGPFGGIRIKPFQWNWGDHFDVIFKRLMEGHVPQESTALECMQPVFQPGDTTLSYGMYNEPDTPYVFGEWDFDLKWSDRPNSTHQFRCVSVYGLTDNHNGVDPNMDDNQGNFRIDSEVMYQLNQIFNPIELKDVANKDTFRWVQKGPMASTIVLTSHECLGDDHEVWIPAKWGYYCNDSEKVLAYTPSGVVLLVRDVDYTISDDTISIIDDHDGYAYKVLYTTVLESDEPWHVGRWEWTVLGESSLPSDSLGASMLTAAWSDWKNVECWLSGLDVMSAEIAPSIPVVMRAFASATEKEGYYYNYPDDTRTAFRDDWCTPEDWDGSWTIHPYAVSSSNIQIVGGPLANLAAYYSNDFTDALIFTNYGDGFYAPGCWARTTQDHFEEATFVDVVDDTLWYNSVTTSDDVGHAIVSVYKDLNETVGFVVYGYTAEDTYYTCYALRGGLLDWLQYVQDGTTTIILEIDYSSLHPVEFHIAESLGKFTECTGFDTNFKTSEYTANYEQAMNTVMDNADRLGICYKLVDISWCAQVHPDP